MDLRQKIGQLMVFGFKAEHPSKLSDEIKDLIENHHVGGIILFGRNIGTPDEIQKLTTTLQATAKNAGQEQPLFICIDQENGVVRRLGEGTTVFPGAMLLGATGDSELAYEIGKASGEELIDLGINWNLSPVVDVNNNPNNPVIDVRSFGERPEMVAEFGKQLMKGMQSSGLITTLKHFPGHGDTKVDSHLALPVIPHDLDRLRNIELLPFKESIDSGADTVMSSHVYFPSIEPEANRPATMSRAVMTGLLRDELGFDGVITTDCMEMKAIADGIGTAQGAVEAIKAGVDLIMISHLPSLQHETIEHVYQAVISGEIEEKTIDDAYERVMRLKRKSLKWNEELKVFSAKETHKNIAEDVMRKGITILEHKKGILPLPKEQSHRILVIYPENSYLTQVEDERFSENALGELVKELNQTAKVISVSQFPDQSEIDFMKFLANSADTIIVGTLSATRSEGQKRMMSDMLNLNKPLIHIAMRSPYDLGLFPEADVSVATFEFTTPALRLAVHSLFGLEKVSGTLPVSIQDMK
ncbi:beta-N-acetylhexosaminidase [Pseudalkalibacillus sp. A8]|uniref:beta-N-acetylhexosaminidase n=1 Tax=Pseudalkalibacillus sp. A8 TaxID=3382641 RepID=UPI0038B4A702